VIVISGALVLVALILLVIGVVGPDLTFVYASIVVSLVSLVFLVIGILQRRGEPAPAEAAATPAPVADDPADGVTAVLPGVATGATRAGSSGPGTTDAATEAAGGPATAPAAGAGDRPGSRVLVVEGRPRYHVAGCRYLTGKSAEEIDVEDARTEGFAACGVCKPDQVLAEQSAATGTADGAADEAAVEPVVEEDVPGVQVPAARRSTTTRSSGTRTSGRSTSTARAKATPAKRSAARESTDVTTASPRKASAAKSSAAESSAAKPSAAKSSAAKSAAAKSSPAKAAAAPAKGAARTAGGGTRAGSVVVVPDRDRYHRHDCRFVRDAPDAEVLSKTAAGRQGFTPCGVCKP
jgi:hypothetical protein